MSDFSEKSLTWSKQLREGMVLSIDPSSGSKGSMPGYAIFKAGELIESGTIQLPVGKPLCVRLQTLCQTLQEEFEVPDVLITEAIYFSRNNKAGVSLQRSIGVVLAAFPVNGRVIEVSPNTWRKLRPETYEKTDENDAIMMGYTALLEVDETTEIPERILEQ